MAWKDDVALEMWIERGPSMVWIRLEGTLDEATGTNLARVVDSCLAEGTVDVELDTARLRIERGGSTAMDAIRDRVHAVGGQLYWDCAAVA
jgi:hypothetical protein